MSEADAVRDTGLAPTVAAEYAQWLERVDATHQAVRYTCTYRLGDPESASQVAVQVVAGLVARPLVFRYFGLPFSGRIASLAETRIAEAAAGTLARVCDWAELRDRFDEVPDRHRHVLVASCVRGHDIAVLAHGLGCDEVSAAAAREATLAHMRDMVAPGLPPAPDPDDRSGSRSEEG